MIEFPNYNKAIIVAGDGDYYCLIEIVVTGITYHFQLTNAQNLLGLFRHRRQLLCVIAILGRRTGD